MMMKKILLCIFAIAALQVTAMEHELGSNSMFSDRAVHERTAPVGRVVTSDAAAAVAKEPRTGEQVFIAACGTCHSSGLLGAPKPGAAWAPLKPKGIETLLTNAKNGINGMPAMGACGDCSDEELTAAIEYMMNQ